MIIAFNFLISFNLFKLWAVALWDFIFLKTEVEKNQNPSGFF